MDTTSFFLYPTESDAALPQRAPGFLTQRDHDDWSMLLEHTETRSFHAGEDVIAAGARDRALYLLIDGRLQAPGGVIEPVATFGEAAFLDERPRAVSVHALSDGALLRLGYDAFEALSARRPALGREILLDVGRILCSRLGAAADTTPGWTG